METIEAAVVDITEDEDHRAGDDDGADDADHARLDHAAQAEAQPRQAAACACGTCDACAKSARSTDRSTAQAAAKPAKHGLSFHKASELEARKVPITSGGQWTTIYSLRLDQRTTSDRIATSGEAQLTTCGPGDIGKPGCDKPTPFDPELEAKIVLADAPGDATGPQISDSDAMTCTRHTKYPAHHCALGLGERVKSLPAGQAKFANLVVAAKGPKNGHDMTVDPHKGGVRGGVTVSRWSASEAPDTRTYGSGGTGKVHKPGTKAMKTSRAGSDVKKHAVPRVTMQAKITNVLPGDILSVGAILHVSAFAKGPDDPKADGARHPWVGHEVLVSKTDKQPWGKNQIAQLTRLNGTNVGLGQTRTFHKAGMTQLPKQVDQKPLPGVVFVSVVSVAKRSAVVEGKDTWKISPKSTMTIVRRREP